ncbi:hypothetical protein NC653_036043 [Populus alba x Populus x berolinensis]|uniref:Uncharacterized protein n=1 Tax=Populus alba x Populus x berolinensis TaxID=444605 RepID=A0AAD6LIX6_9ROSI|nr:hypothetical protein NC653_036043 [Populus alba x Populus x berolinensis]
MARKKSWFGWVRRLFVSEQKPKGEKKSKRWKWFLGGLKVKQCLALPAPQRTVSEASETQKKYALTVALATAAAADAAVAAAHAAAEVVRLTGASHPSRHFTKGVESLAAIKIQSAFRAYLARKALVKLQAIVRGQVVRRQSLIIMKHLPSNAKMRSEVQAKGITADGFCKNGENKHAVKSKKEVQEKETKVGEMILQLLKVPEVVFWHIPSKAYKKVAPRLRIHKACVGSMNKEKVAAQEAELGIMDMLVKRSSVKAVFAGHNHGLDWCCPYKKLWLCYARHTGYGGYGNWPRGARILEINDHPFYIKSWIKMEDGDEHSQIILCP